MALEPGPRPEDDTPSGSTRQAGPEWERDVLNRLAFASLREQRRARRWSIAFKFLFLTYLVAVLVVYAPPDMGFSTAGERHTALVDVTGVIAADSDASADKIVGGLRAAFEDEDTAGVILRINSPGGSPVQAGYITDEIGRLRKKYPDIPIYAVISDIAASGGYYVAVAADKIYANRASVVGSIGVLMNGFGFVEAMEKLGVERRLLTAGQHKGFLDPFSPANPDEVAHIEGVLGEIHNQFIAVVKQGRGSRLKEDPTVFSGLIWSGEESVRLGLVDALGSASHVAREVIGEEDIIDFTPRRNFVDLVSSRLGASMLEGFVEAVSRATLR